MIRDKSLQPSQSAWLESFYQYNSFTKGTPRCLPRFDFPADFNVTFSDNHWSNTEKSIELFEKVIFPYLKQAKASLTYPEEQMSLIIKDTFKGQDNNVILDLCEKHMCQVFIVPHNLTNKFLALDITVNKPAKSFIILLVNSRFGQLFMFYIYLIKSLIWSCYFVVWLLRIKCSFPVIIIYLLSSWFQNLNWKYPTFVWLFLSHFDSLTTKKGKGILPKNRSWQK